MTEMLVRISDVLSALFMQKSGSQIDFPSFRLTSCYSAVFSAKKKKKKINIKKKKKIKNIKIKKNKKKFLKNKKKRRPVGILAKNSQSDAT